MERKLDTSSAREPRLSDGDRRRNRAYNKRFVPAMVIYVALLVAGLQMTLDSVPKRVLFIAIPVVPAVLTVWAVVRQMQDSDEYQRLAGYRAMAIGFAGAMVAGVMMGFVGIAFKGDIGSEVGGWVAFGVGMVSWFAAGMATARR